MIQPQNKQARDLEQGEQVWMPDLDRWATVEGMHLAPGGKITVKYSCEQRRIRRTIKPEVPVLVRW